MILRFLRQVDGDITSNPTTITDMPTHVTEVTDHLPTSADMVIIGGGILGTATAFNASRRGLRVVVVERGKRLGGLTTQASAGGYRMQFDTPEEIALLKDLWRSGMRSQMMLEMRPWICAERSTGTSGLPDASTALRHSRRKSRSKCPWVSRAWNG